MIKRFFCLALFSLPLLLSAQTPDYLHETDAQRDARMAWWKDARFGLFLHWGLYAVAAGEYGGQKNYGEWLMYEAKIPKPEYEKFAPQFNPVKFDADAWVRMAKEAGMKYIVITSKHHDGFCMFDSKVSDYDIADRTPFRRDPLRELADACRREGLKLCFYHSIMDWHHPDATAANFPRYREEYLKPQLRELLTNYGDLGVLWFDGEWIDEWTEPQGRDLYNFVRNLQPNIIVNNRVGKGRNGMQGMNNSEEAAGDFGTPEQEILGESSGLPWESCMTMNDHWGYNSHDKNYKSVADLIWNLADITAKGGNYLLNIGPTAEGTFPEESIERLRAIGEWTRRHAPAIYGTKTWHHWQEGENIRYAQGKSGEVYAFVRGLPASRKLILKKIVPAPRSAVVTLSDHQSVPWIQTEDGVEITLPEGFRADAQPVWVFRLSGKPAELSNVPVISAGSTEQKKMIVFTGEAEVHINSGLGADIYYTLDGSEPTLKSKMYTGVFRLNKSTVVKAIARIPGKMSSETAVVQFAQSRYGVQIETAYSDKYAASGVTSLTDGVRGSTRFTDGRWLGFEGADFSATLDLGKKSSIHSVSASFLRVIPSWIFLPTGVEVSVSDDGQHFSKIAETTLPAATDSDANDTRTITLKAEAQGRYVRIKAQNQGVCPPWHPGAGAKSWLFVDEVWVE